MTDMGTPRVLRPAGRSETCRVMDNSQEPAVICIRSVLSLEATYQAIPHATSNRSRLVSRTSKAAWSVAAVAFHGISAVSSPPWERVKVPPEAPLVDTSWTSQGLPFRI